MHTVVERLDSRKHCEMSSSEKLTCKGTLRMVFMSEDPSLPRFLLGVIPQFFVGSEYGQKKSG